MEENQEKVNHTLNCYSKMFYKTLNALSDVEVHKTQEL